MITRALAAADRAIIRGAGETAARAAFQFRRRYPAAPPAGPAHAAAEAFAKALRHRPDLRAVAVARKSARFQATARAWWAAYDVARQKEHARARVGVYGGRGARPCGRRSRMRILRTCSAA
jgi:hypothetical protein